MHSNTVLAGRRGMEEGEEQGDSGMRQLTLSKGPARMGIHNHVRRAAIPSKGFSHLNNPLYMCIFYLVMCVPNIKRKYSFCAG
jgi:hypothetical protein